MNRIFAAFLIAGCAPPAEGEWTGQCETTDADLRVRLDILGPDQEAQPPALATLHLADRPQESLQLECDMFENDGSSVVIDDCFGFWTASGDRPGPFDFRVDGTLANDTPTDTMGGRCTFDDIEGPLELVRTP